MIEAVEWLPSGAESGLVRVRGRWEPGSAPAGELPALVLRANGRDHRFDSLPDARFGRDPQSWRGSYLVPAELVVADPEAMWIEWPDGVRAGLPAMTRGIEPPPIDAPEKPTPPQTPEGGQVIDRAVLAERRARRAEAAEQAQARVAAEAVKAVEVLELRSAELERRLAEATAERDAISAQALAGEPTERERRALAAALETAAHLRSQAREWRLQLRASEVARSSDAVHLAVVEDERTTIDAAQRAALHERAAELEAARVRAAEAAELLVRAEADAAAAHAELERARSIAAAEFEDARSAWDRRRGELETALAGVRAELQTARAEADQRVADAVAAATEERAAAIAEAERRAAGVRAIHEEVRGELQRRLDAERAARTAAEQSEGALRAELSARIDDLSARLAQAEAELHEAGPRVTAAEAAAQSAASRLQVESVARAALEDELDRERTAHAAARGEAEAARGEAEAARGEAAAARGEITSIRTGLEALRSDLEAERAARREAEAALAAAQASAEEAGASLQVRIAELERTAASASDPDRLERLAREQAAAADARAAEAGDAAPATTDLAARLDAAAAALRSRAPEARDEPAYETVGQPVPDIAHASEAPEPLAIAPAPLAEWHEAAPRHEQPPAGVAGDAVPPPPEPAFETVGQPIPEPAAAEAADEAVAAPEAPVRPTIVSPAKPPPRADATGTSLRGYPTLRGALVKLAHDDPAAAGRLLVGLLPAQGAIVEGSLAYDLTIREVGTFGVTITDGTAQAEPIDAPRGRREADFHLTADALTLAELLAGVDHRIGRWRGDARIRGRRRRRKPLLAVPRAELTLTDAARAGARLEPGLAWQALAYTVHPTWTRGLAFTVATTVEEGEPVTWYLTARDGGGLASSTSAPDTDPTASVTMSRAAFDRLLREEPHPGDDRPSIRGDHTAVAALLALVTRAR
jgi:hypothetical protein